MFRNYEDPWMLEDQIKALQVRIDETTDEDELMWLYEELAELKDRARFAWDDQEYDECYAS